MSGVSGTLSAFLIIDILINLDLNLITLFQSIVDKPSKTD